jgi:plastocyanin
MIPRFTRRGFMTCAMGAPIALSSLSTLANAHTGVIHEIEIKSFTFNPDVLEVKIGDHVRWTNRDLSPHTATAKDISWDTEILELGQSGEVEVTQDLVTEYFCTYHPNMKAKLIIV